MGTVCPPPAARRPPPAARRPPPAARRPPPAALSVIGTALAPGFGPAVAVRAALAVRPAATVNDPPAGLTVTPDPAGGVARQVTCTGAPAALVTRSVEWPDAPASTCRTGGLSDAVSGGG